MAIDTNDIKCEYTLRETEFHTAAFLNGQQKIDLTTPFNGKAEHKMGDIVSIQNQPGVCSLNVQFHVRFEIDDCFKNE